MDYKLCLIGVLTALILSGCKKTGESKIDFLSGVTQKTSKEFLIPRELRETIEKEYLAYIRKENIKNVLPDKEILARIPREFLDVDILLKESSHGVLSDNVEFKLPRGGGEIDLKNYVKGPKGSFYLAYRSRRAQGKVADTKALHVYFLSEAKERMIDHEKFGVGCQKYMDITDLMAKANSDDGLQLNATDHRYVPVITGVLYFVDFDAERKIFISAVRIFDSRYPEETCQEPRN